MKIVEENGRFIALDEDSQVMGELIFNQSGEDLWTIDYVYVKIAYRGQNIGGKIMEYAAQAAREKDIKIQPICSFARYEADKNKEKYEDVLCKP